MYDPHSVVGSGSSEDGRSSPSHTLSSSDSEARTPPISIVPVCEHTLRCSDVRGPVVNGGGFARSQQSNNAPQNHFSSRSRSAQTINPRTAIDGRPSAFAGVAARGKVLDDFVPSRSIKEQPQGMPRNPSIKNLEIPRGKHEQLPLSRPDTPSRLPRHRVFIKQSTSRTSVVDAVAVTQDAEDENEAVFVTREVPVNSVDNGCRLRDASDLPNMQSLRDEEFYFSDEGEIEEEPVDFKRDPYTPVNASDVLSSRVRRAVSALRSISFQSNQFEDLDTAWGQAGAVEFAKDRKTRLPESTCGSRWRRPRGRISSKNGVQEFGCYSENDARSTRSYGSNMSVRDRAFGGRDQVRGAPGMKDRGNYVSHHKRSLWSGGRRDRNPQARAAQLLVNYGGQGLLAASSEPRDLDNALTTVSQADALDMTGRSPNRRSVDKYVEFIHASAQRETRNKLSHKSFSSRVISKVFRRRWN